MEIFCITNEFIMIFNAELDKKLFLSNIVLNIAAT